MCKNRQAIILAIGKTQRLPVMMQAEAAVCHQCGSSREKHGIDSEKKESFDDDRPALTDVGSVVCVRAKLISGLQLFNL